MSIRFKKFCAAMPLAASLALVAPMAMAQDAAPVADLVAAVDIPHQKFTLDNGLTVIVHEDRKAPIVAVSVWYDVGSKHEPKGKTGYAHLFEHIMFNGSAAAPGDYFNYTSRIGATDLNGTTWLDRTNYFQTVPKAALEAALFLEADRMGNLLPAIDQDKLTNQIGVVQNEKRQGDNQPYGLVSYRQTELLFPEGHPYAHDTIGSLEDLQAASLDDMRNWFIDHYGPNNAILVLAGDINTAEARPLVEKYFGSIARGKDVAPVSAPIPTLDAPVKEVMYDKVPTTRIYRNWVVPGLTDPDYTAIRAGTSILGGLSSSRLDNVLVREEQLAVGVSSFVLPFVSGSLLQISVDVKPGVDADLVGKRLDEILADLLANGPSADEVSRVATNEAANRIAGLEQVGGFRGKAVALASGELFANDSNYYKTELQRLAALTPDTIRTAMNKWLSRPVVEIRVEPGEREAYKEVAAAAEPSSDKQVDPDYSALPEIGEVTNVDFPDVETATLSNGIKVYFAETNAVPTVRVAVNFDIGSAADPADKSGLHGLVTAMLDEGTTTRTSIQIAETEERLGANVSVGGGLDDSTVSVRAVTPNLGPALDLLADVIKNPAFDAGELERVRQQQLTRIAGENRQPIGLALRNLPPLIYGDEHPYGKPLTGSGDPAVVSSLTRDDLLNFHSAWMRPEKAEIFVVGDVKLDNVIPMLEQRFGAWAPAGEAAPDKNLDAIIPDQQGRIIVINQPNSPQSLILAAQVLNAKGTDDLFALQASNEALGGDFLSRINFDLRETKGWSYGSRTILQRPDDRVPFLVFAPVQTNKTGPSLEAIVQNIKEFVGDKGVTPAELERIVDGNIRQLPGSYEQSSAILGQLQADVRFGRDFDYAEKLATRYKSLDAVSLDAAMREAINPDGFTWVIVGDAAKIEPQIADLGLPIEYRGYESGSEEADTSGDQ